MSTLNHYCSVPLCKTWAKKDLVNQFSFHRFPPEGEKIHITTHLGTQFLNRREAWKIKLRIGKPITKFMKVCSLHFTNEDYIQRGKNTGRGRILKKTAVPSQHLPLQIIKESSKLRASRVKKRNCVKEHNEYAEQSSAHDNDDVTAAQTLLSLLQTPDISMEVVEKTLVQHPNLTNVRDAEVQVNTPRVSTLKDLLLTDDALRSFTGVSNFKIFNSIVNLAEKMCKDEKLHRLNVKDRVLLTFVKLKLDLSYTTIGVLFSNSSEVCKQYFWKMLTVLSAVLKPCIYFPTRDEILANLPIHFKNFESTRVVLDCTEIFVQRPSCLCCRVRFYSHYKSCSTIKFMTGVSPGGLITFISQPYGGRASDKLIFENSNLIQLLDPNVDAIMVDKGFVIDDICAIHKIQIIRPPFLRKKKQLSADESLFNRQIAAARVHIERSNQRLKIFKILSGKLQWNLVPKIDEIFTIICGVTNLSAPILHNERFM